MKISPAIIENLSPKTKTGDYFPPIDLETAILQTLAYADIFDHPITLEEIHRYLIGVPASLGQVRESLLGGRLLPERINKVADYYMLPGRASIAGIRRRREIIAAELWPHALGYGRLIASLPFVKMVAVTGALAVDNVESDADIDYLVITSLGYLWVCRAMIIGLGRLKYRNGAIICPNYLLTENAIALRERDMYTAQELARMIPISGFDIYNKMRAENLWTTEYLPNAKGAPRAYDNKPSMLSPFKSFGETILRTRFGARIEGWEMDRKINKLTKQSQANNMANPDEIRFGEDWCKGHFDGHAHRATDEFNKRLDSFEEIIK